MIMRLLKLVEDDRSIMRAVEPHIDPALIKRMREYVRDNADWALNLPGRYEWWKHARLDPEKVDGGYVVRLFESPTEHCQHGADLCSIQVSYEDLIGACASFDQLVLMVRKIGYNDVPIRGADDPEGMTWPNHVVAWSKDRVLTVRRSKSGRECDTEFIVAPRWTVELPNFDSAHKTWNLMLLDELRRAKSHHSAYVLDQTLDVCGGAVPERR